MLSFLKRFARTILIVLGLALIALFIWYAGPYFGFGELHPFESVTVRLILIGLVIACWIGSIILKRVRAYRASDKLLESVIAQPPATQNLPPAEVAKLRERFEAAVASLKEQRRSGHSLYDLPWYVFIGAPGSGKTTALVNSGLRFSLEQRFGKEALSGVGGTRNCDWWFTDEAVFLDTAGRYTTQDSDPASDSVAWREFLGLLRKYRGRRPINGVILTINARDLMVQGEAALAGHVEATHRRLKEINQELQIQVPVYLMVTKCDLVAGFSEYFEDLNQDGRTQVWGVTFPYEQTTSGEAARVFVEEFDELMVRLNQRVFGRVDESRDGRRRAKVFAFPQQMAALRDSLSQFVSEVFGSARFEQQVLLRGVYFTSGTQDGTPVDRLLGAIGRRFGVAEAVAPSSGPGKAYFVEQLLRDVLIGESGLAGVNRKLETRKAAMQLGAYAALALITLLGLIALTVSYRRNSSYLDDAKKDVATLELVPPAPPRGSLEAVLPRLDAINTMVESVDRYRGDVPWAMGWGLYQGSSIGDAARDAYTRTLDGVLLPRVTDRIKGRVVEHMTDPERLYVYLKAYLMLGEPEHLDKAYLKYLADVEWKNAGGGSSDVGNALSKHFQNLLDYRDALRPMPNDATLVGQARNSIRQASLPRIMYGQIQRFYAADPRTIQLNTLALGVDQVFTRKSGHSLADPLPALYTRPVFKEVTGQNASALVKQFAGEAWVWGDAGVAGANTPNLKEVVIGIYEQDYIASWDELLRDLQFVPFTTASRTADALRILTSPTSPLRALLKAVADNTTLVEGPSATSALTAGAVDAARKKITDSLGSLIKPITDAVGGSGTTAGAMVTAHFQGVQQLTAGAPGSQPIDPIFGLMGQIEQQLRALGPDVSGRDPMDALSSPELNTLWQSLQQQASALPPPIDTLIGQVAHGARGSVISDATGELEARYQRDILTPCRAVIEGRYPFASGSKNDVTLADFSRMFGYNGLFDKFFAENLAKQVDVSQQPWAWRPGSVSPSRSLLVQFETAQLIRDRFFPPGSQAPRVGFSLTFAALDPGSTRFTLQIDEQNADINTTDHPAGFRWTAEWPGKSGIGQAVATFQDRYGPQPSANFAGPWAWFRLLDQNGSAVDTREVLTITKQTDRLQHQVQVTVAAESATGNPFVTRDWRRFTCGN